MTAAAALPATVGKATAVAAIDDHLASWLVRMVAPVRGAPTSIELVHLPFWRYPFTAHRADGGRAWTGHLAIEPIRRTVAVLPETVRLGVVPANATLLPAAGAPPEDEVRRILMWETLARRRRDRPDSVIVGPANLLYAPYWIAYLSGPEWQMMPVDATTGKIDLAMKDALLDALIAAEGDAGPPPP